MFYVVYLVRTSFATTDLASLPGINLVRHRILTVRFCTTIQRFNPSGAIDYQALFLLILASTGIKSVHQLQSSCSRIHLLIILTLLMFLAVLIARFSYALIVASVLIKRKLLGRGAKRIGNVTDTAVNVWMVILHALSQQVAVAVTERVTLPVAALRKR